MADDVHKTTIKIDGDSAGAQKAAKDTAGAIGTVQTSLLGVRSAIGAATRALGVFWLAWNGITTVIGWVGALNAKLKEMQTATARAGFDRAFSSAAVATAQLVGRQKELNDALKEQERLLQRGAELRELQNAAGRDFEDARRGVERAEALAGVADPRQRRQMQDRFAAEDEARAAAAAKARSDAEAAALRQRAAIYDDLAKSARAHSDELTKQLAVEEQLLQRLKAAKNADAERTKAVEERIAALRRERAEADAAASTAREESDYAGLKADIIGRGAAAQGAAAAERAGAWRETDAADAKAYAEHQERMSKAAAEDEYDRAYNALDDQGKIMSLKMREERVRGEMQAAEAELADEMKKDVKDRSEERISRATKAAEAAQSDLFATRMKREALEGEMAATRKAEASGMADALAGTMQSGGNRLTAMGLGSGAESGRDVTAIRDGVGRIIDLLRQEVAAIDRQKSGQGPATYAE